MKETDIQKRHSEVSVSEIESLDNPRLAKFPKSTARSTYIHQNAVNATTPFEEFIVENLTCLGQ